MTAINHAVAGSLIMAVVGNPVVGLPLALLSHFLLDALPHFGAHTVADPKSKEFKAVLVTDGFLTLSFMLIVGFAGYKVGLDWWLLPLGATFAWMPDLMWFKHYISGLRGEELRWDPVRRFHKKIQRWELSWGWIVELIWFVALVALLGRILFK